jgi:hypothetical protein
MLPLTAHVVLLTAHVLLLTAHCSLLIAYKIASLPLCRMVPMLTIRHALKGDITKLEADFFNGYRDGDRVFYLSATDSKGNFQFVDDEVRAS